MEITEKKYREAHELYPAKGWVKFAFRFLSKESVDKGLRPGKTVGGILLITFLVGFLSTTFNLNDIVVKIATLSYFSVISVLAIFLFSAVYVNNKRITSVRTELGGVSKEEYSDFASRFK